MNQLRSGTTPQPRPYISVPRHYCNMTVPQAISVSFCTPPEPFSCPARTLPGSLLCLFRSAGVTFPHNTPHGTPVGILYHSCNTPVPLSVWDSSPAPLPNNSGNLSATLQFRFIAHPSYAWYPQGVRSIDVARPTKSRSLSGLPVALMYRSRASPIALREDSRTSPVPLSLHCHSASVAYPCVQIAWEPFASSRIFTGVSGSSWEPLELLGTPRRLGASEAFWETWAGNLQAFWEPLRAFVLSIEVSSLALKFRS